VANTDFFGQIGLLVALLGPRESSVYWMRERRQWLVSGEPSLAANVTVLAAPAGCSSLCTAEMFSISVLPFFCCNEARITIFPGTCAALDSLR